MGDQNRPQEAPKADKRRHRRKKNTKEQEAAAKSEQTRPKRVPRRIWVGQKRFCGGVPAECAGPPGRIIGGVRRVIKRNKLELTLN